MFRALRSLLFARPRSELRGFSGTLVRLGQILWFAGRELRAGYCFERAATLSFATLISLIPLAVLLLGTAVQFGVGDKFINYAKERVFPQLAPAFQADLAQWLEYNISKNAFAQGVVGVVGLGALITLVMTALGVLTTAERNFNRLWKVEGSRGYLQRLATFWIILTVSPFIVTASLWIEDFLVPRGGLVERWTQQSLALRTVYAFVVPVTIGFLGFTVLYRYLPATRVRLRSAALGAIAAALLWEGTKKSFYFYVARSSPVTSLYGSLAIVPLFLVWVYINWVIILLGCTLAYAHQNHPVLSKRFLEASKSRRLPLRFVGVYVLERAARAFVSGGEPPTAEEVSDELCVDVARVEEAGRLLAAAGLLSEDSGRTGAYLLRRSPERIQLADALACLPGEEDALDSVAVSETGPSPGSPAPAPACGALALFLQARARYSDAFREATLSALLADAPVPSAPRGGGQGTVGPQRVFDTRGPSL
ncbi:MAG: YihY family inner membrane protein [Planctomycetes bacterium]|nr:YihY family inner membrane protein [Planctomycetota bacterium]